MRIHAFLTAAAVTLKRLAVAVFATLIATLKAIAVALGIPIAQRCQTFEERSTC